MGRGEIVDCAGLITTGRRRVASGDGSTFKVYIHHTDGKREWAYDRKSHIGKLDKGLDEANVKGWTVVDMKKDWIRIFPFDELR